MTGHYETVKKKQNRYRILPVNVTQYLPKPRVLCCHTNPAKNLPKKMEITDSGKFIEVERSEVESEVPQESDTIDESENETDNMPVTVTPNASPGKTVRIKENGAKANGDTEVLYCL